MQTLNAWCRSLQTENDHLAVDVKYLAAKCEALEQQGGNLCDWRDYLSRATSDLADHIDKLEAFSRRNNVRFFNVCETTNEDYNSCAGKVVRLLNEFYPFKTWMEEDVERAHRVGPKGNNQPRLLLARMHHWSDKLSLLSERTCRQNMANQVGVRVAADLTDRQQEELRKHSEQGRTAYYRSGRLHVRERQPRRRDPASEVDKRLLESQLPPLADMDHYPALRRQQSPTDYQQSRAAASSGSRDRCVIQISPTSATTRGLPLRGNASVNDSYDDTRGSDSVPVVRVDHHQPHIVADKESRDLGVTQTSPMPVATPTTTDGLSLRGNPPTTDRADDVEGPDAVPVDSAAGHHQQSHVAASSEGQDRGVIESPPMPVATSIATGGLPPRGNVPTSDRSDDTEGPDAVPVGNADGADNADDNHQQSRVAASSESKDRCVTQSPLMSTTTDGLPLRENAPTSGSSDDIRGPDASPTDNLHGNILDASQEASDEESCAAATGPTTLSEGDVTTAGSDHLPTCMAAGESGGVADVAQQDHSSTPSRGPETRSQGKRQTHLTDSFTRVGSSRNTPRSYRQTNSIS